MLHENGYLLNNMRELPHGAFSFNHDMLLFIKPTAAFEDSFLSRLCRNLETAWREYTVPRPTLACKWGGVMRDHIYEVRDWDEAGGVLVLSKMLDEKMVLGVIQAAGGVEIMMIAPVGSYTDSIAAQEWMPINEVPYITQIDGTNIHLPKCFRPHHYYAISYYTGWEDPYRHERFAQGISAKYCSETCLMIRHYGRDRRPGNMTISSYYGGDVLKRSMMHPNDITIDNISRYRHGLAAQLGNQSH